MQKLTRHPVTYIDMTPGYVDTTEFWKGQKRAPGYEMQIEPWRRRATHLSSICVASSILSWTNSIYFLETPNLRRDIHWCPGGFVSVWNRSPFFALYFDEIGVFAFITRRAVCFKDKNLHKSNKNNTRQPNSERFMIDFWRFMSVKYAILSEMICNLVFGIASYHFFSYFCGKINKTTKLWLLLSLPCCRSPLWAHIATRHVS